MNALCARGPVGSRASGRCRLSGLVVRREDRTEDAGKALLELRGPQGNQSRRTYYARVGDPCLPHDLEVMRERGLGNRAAEPAARTLGSARQPFGDLQS